MHADSDPPADGTVDGGYTLRSTSSTLAEMTIFCLMVLLPAVLLFTMPSPTPVSHRVVEFLRFVGPSALDGLPWFLGLNTTFFLACYLMLATESLRGPQVPSPTRQLLGTVAEALFAFQLTAALAAVGGFIEDPRRIGELFFLVPTLGLIAFFTFQLGRFTTLTDRALLANAQKYRARLQARHAYLEPYAALSGMKIFWFNVAVTSLAAFIGGALTTVLVGHPYTVGNILRTGAIALGMTLMCAAPTLWTLSERYQTDSRRPTSSVWIFQIWYYFQVLSTLVLMVILGRPGPAVAVAVGLAAIVATGSLPRGARPKPGRFPTLRIAAFARAQSRVMRAQTTNERRIQNLTAALDRRDAEAQR